METNWISYEDYLTKIKKKYTKGLETAFFEYLSKPDAPPKIPFIEVFQDLSDIIPVTYETTSIKDFHFPNDTEFKVIQTRQVKSPTWDVLRYISMKIYSKTKEKTIQTYQRGMPIKTAGRMRGNMEYLEDRWRVQIQSPTIKYAHINKNDELAYSDAKQFKLRDKYIKIRVRYDGTQYAIVNGIKTYYRISYA